MTGVSEVDTVQFVDLAAGKTVVLAGLTVTAPAAGLTAKQVAAVFANLADGQLTGWSTGAVSGTSSDTVTIGAAPTKAISGGSGGVDTLVVNFAGNAFNPASTNISGFETLGLGDNATGTYDITGFTGLTQGAVAADVVYANEAAGVGLKITASPTFNTTYTLKDATGTSDSLALTLKKAGTIAAGTVNAAGVESISVEATDSTSGVKAGATADSVTLADTAAKSVTVTGNTTLTLVTQTGASSKLTSVDASGMTGGLS